MIREKKMQKGAQEQGFFVQVNPNAQFVDTVNTLRDGDPIPDIHKVPQGNQGGSVW